MSVTYNRPPLKEAICELRFILKADLTVHQINEFYSKVADLFPTQAKGHNFFIRSGPKEGNPDEIEVEQKTEQFDRFLNEATKTNLHVTGNGVVSLHKLEPYHSWKDFFPLVQEVYSKFYETLSPVNVGRLGLRYVNEINIPATNFRLEDYFNYDLNFPIENKTISQQLNLVFATNDEKDRINVKISEMTRSSQDDKKFILDLDYFSIKNKESDLVYIFKWIENAHSEIENYFESIISTQTKELFK